MSNRLALGTVQFGLAYGIANQSGQVSRDESAAIVNAAWAEGFDTLDTAIAYGESEYRLGEIGVAQWRVVSKLPAIPERCSDVAAWARDAVLGSLERLKLPKLRGLLLHRPQDLLGPHGDAVYQALVRIKDERMVEKIGVSVYSPDEIDALWSRHQLDLVQAPYNIMDRRLVTSGWLSRLHQAGTEVHVRSIFLQGLLLMSLHNRPMYFDRWQPLWQTWHRWLVDQQLSPLEACLGFALLPPEIDRVVVGVDSVEHLREIVAASHVGPLEFPNDLANENPDLINPSKWITV